MSRFKSLTTDGRLVEVFDFLGFDSAAVQGLLRRWGVARHPRALVVWSQDRAGCEIDSELLIRFYDELWYPSSDDVWIGYRDAKWMVELDHEETARLWQMV